MRRSTGSDAQRRHRPAPACAVTLAAALAGALAVTAPSAAAASAGTLASSPAAPAPACTRDQLGLSVRTIGPAYQGHLQIRLTNTGSTACDISGYPAVQMLAPGNRTIDVVQTKGRTAFAQDPGASLLTLQEGATAVSDLTYGVAPGRGTTIDRLLITPPGALTQRSAVALSLGAHRVTTTALAVEGTSPAAAGGAAQGPVLRVGSRGDAVAAWQRTLNARFAAGRPAHSPVSVDGAYGPNTGEATRSLQRDLGFTRGDVDGVVGPATRSAVAGSGRPAPQRIAKCTSGQAIVSITRGSPGAGTIGYQLRFRHSTQDVDCTLTGFPGVSYVDSRRRIVGSPAGRAATAPVRTVVLRGDVTAVASLRAVNVGGGAVPGCGPARVAGLRVYPPGTRYSQVLAGPYTACTATDLPIRVLSVGPVSLPPA